MKKMINADAFLKKIRSFKLYRFLETDDDGWCYDMDKAPIGERAIYLLERSNRPYYLVDDGGCLYTDMLTRHVYKKEFSDVDELFIDHKTKKDYQRIFNKPHKLRVVAWQPLPPIPQKKK